MRSKLSTSKNHITANMGKILYSRPILYVIFIICLFQLFVFTSIGDYYSAAIFVLVGFLTSFFSKNMLVILVIALVITNILKYGTKVRQEGFDDETTDTSSSMDSTDTSSSIDKASSMDKASSTDKASSIDKASIPIKTMSKIANTSKATTPVSESQLKRLEDVMAQYKDLMFTQEQMTGNMAELTKGLTKAEGLINSISNMKQ